MANTKGNGPKPLERKVVRRLLELLSSDDDFRALFQRDAHAALVQAGWTPPADADKDTEMAQLSGGNCLQLASDKPLASKEQIRRDQQTLEATLGGSVFAYTCPQELQA